MNSRSFPTVCLQDIRTECDWDEEPCQTIKLRRVTFTQEEGKKNTLAVEGYALRGYKILTKKINDINRIYLQKIRAL